jgi:hypothetical protein
MRRITPLLMALLLAACSSGSPPSTMQMPDGVREHAYVTDVEAAGDGSYVLTVDRAQFLTGDEANQAAVEDGFINDGDTVPGGYYIVNESSELEELPLDPDAPVALNVCLDDVECDVPAGVSVELWVDMLSGDIPGGQLDGFKWYVGGNLPYALILDGGTIVGVEEEYLP